MIRYTCITQSSFGYYHHNSMPTLPQNRLGALVPRLRPVVGLFATAGASNSVSDVRAISANRMQFSVRNEPGRSARRRPLTKLTSDGPAEKRWLGGGQDRRPSSSRYRWVPDLQQYSAKVTGLTHTSTSSSSSSGNIMTVTSGADEQRFSEVVSTAH